MSTQLYRYGSQALQERPKGPRPLYDLRRAEEHFFAWVNRYNQCLEDFVQMDRRFELITHRGFGSPMGYQHLLEDGLHLNNRGLAKYYKSMRRQAILQCHRAQY